MLAPLCYALPSSDLAAQKTEKGTVTILTSPNQNKTKPNVRPSGGKMHPASIWPTQNYCL